MQTAFKAVRTYLRAMFGSYDIKSGNTLASNSSRSAHESACRTNLSSRRLISFCVKPIQLPHSPLSPVCGWRPIMSLLKLANRMDTCWLTEKSRLGNPTLSYIDKRQVGSLPS